MIFEEEQKDVLQGVETDMWYSNALHQSHAFIPAKNRGRG